MKELCQLSLPRVVMLGFAVLLMGCSDGEGGPKAVLKGKLTKGGQPLHVADQELGVGMIELTLYSIQSKEDVLPDMSVNIEDDFDDGVPPANNDGFVYTSYSPEVQPDGLFELKGPSGEGIPPGLYRVVVRQWDPYPEVDRLQGAFSAANSPITIDVSEDRDVNIELNDYLSKK